MTLSRFKSMTWCLPLATKNPLGLAVSGFRGLPGMTLDLLLVPMVGFEPTRLASPPPQDGVSTNFTTSAKKLWKVQNPLIDPVALQERALPGYHSWEPQAVALRLEGGHALRVAQRVAHP
jgi:hypothetical protein